MEEKPQQSGDGEASQAKPSFTYIIQFPKDQIYRVPSHRNAKVITHPPTRRRRNRTYHIPCVLSIFVAAAALLTIVVCLLAIFLKPVPPRFTVEGVRIGATDFDIRLRVENPNNRKTTILYDKGGVAVLGLQSSKIGGVASAPHNWRREDDSEDNSTTVLAAVVVFGITDEFMKDVADARNHSSLVPLRLTVDIPARVKMGIFVKEDAEIHAVCNLEVYYYTREEDGESQLLAQQCKTRGLIWD